MFFGKKRVTLSNRNLFINALKFLQHEIFIFTSIVLLVHQH